MTQPATITLFAVELAELMNRYSPQVNRGQVDCQELAFILLLAGYSADMLHDAENQRAQFQAITVSLGLTLERAFEIGSVFQNHLKDSDDDPTTNS